MKIIKSASTALIQKNEDLSKDLDLLQTSLEFSILNEIKKNNRKIPYSFFGTVAKVDINGFSKVVAAHQGQTTQQMTMNLENFGCELLQRYEGLFEKTIGDEIVVVFKEHDSVLRAAAFSRDLMFEFSQIKFPIENEDRQFTLKSAIYSSEITFSKRSAGYGFTGDALTFTTRLMDAVTIKEKNILSIVSTQANELKSLAQIPEQTELFKFKNMSDQQGYQICDFHSVKDCFNEQTISYFKSNQHIVYFLNLISSNHEKTDLILKSLLKINVRVSSEKINHAWIQTLQTSNANHSLNNSQFAQLIMLSKNLIPRSAWTDDLSKALLQISRQRDGRINASIIEVLIDKDIHTLEKKDKTSFVIANDPSGRTQGNTLVFEAISNLNNKLFDQLLAMIKSSQAHISKSGIYAACQIIEYYREKNPAALATYPSYEKLIDLLSKINTSPKIKLSDRLSDKLKNLF